MHKSDRRTFFKLLFIALFLFANPFIGCVQKKMLAKDSDDNSWFQIAVLPDTQYYTAERHNATLDMFERQIEWITTNYKNEKIAYVAHLGDISDHGEKFPIEWERARNMMYRLEKPLPGLADGIPYGVAVGNHDTTPNGKPKALKTGYDRSFGRAHFMGKSYYGGSYGELNDNHFDLITAGGQDFIILYIAYNENSVKKKDLYDAAYEKEVLNWTGEILKQYKDRKAIIVSHSMLKKPKGSNSNFVPGQSKELGTSNFTAQGKVLYEHFKYYPNVFMMLCGHISGEGYRTETFNGNTIKMYLSDYQGRRNPPYSEKDRNGGNGTMRLMKINPSKETLEVRTFIPKKDGNHIWEEDADSKFVHALYR